MKMLMFYLILYGLVRLGLQQPIDNENNNQ